MAHKRFPGVGMGDVPVESVERFAEVFDARRVSPRFAPLRICTYPYLSLLIPFSGAVGSKPPPGRTTASLSRVREVGDLPIRIHNRCHSPHHWPQWALCVGRA